MTMQHKMDTDTQLIKVLCGVVVCSVCVVV